MNKDIVILALGMAKNNLKDILDTLNTSIVQDNGNYNKEQAYKIERDYNEVQNFFQKIIDEYESEVYKYRVPDFERFSDTSFERALNKNKENIRRLMINIERIQDYIYIYK